MQANLHGLLSLCPYVVAGGLGRESRRQPRSAAAALHRAGTEKGRPHPSWMRPPLVLVGRAPALFVNEGADVLAAEHAHQVALHIHVEDVDGQVVLLAHRRGGEVHHFQPPGVDFVVRDGVELHGVRVFLRVGGVDAVHTRAFQHDVGLDLDAAQRGARVGREIGVAGAAAHDDDLAALEAFDGFPFGIEFADRLHADGREHAALHAGGVEGGAEGEAVDDRGAHAHLVALHAVETFARAAQAAEDVASADDYADLDAEGGGLFDLCGVFVEAFGVDAVPLLAGEAFAAEFEQYSFEFCHGVGF